jgi:hypothetical protein
MTTAATTKGAARSGNPATKAKAAAETAASKKARIEAEAAERAAAEERIRKAQEAFQNLKLPEPEFDEDGYEVIPDKSKLEGQSYKFMVGGKKYVIPNLQYLPASIGMRLGKMTEEDVHTAVFGRYAPDLMDHCSADQLQHILKRWQEYSQGVGLGE